MKAADAHLKCGSKYDAAGDYINAGNCLRKSNLNDAVSCFKLGVVLFAEEGRFSIAAKHQKDIAEACEADGDLEIAIENFELAAEYYEGENATTSANGCLLKVAEFSGTLDKFDKAIEIYEKVASSCIDNPLLKFSCKGYFLQAGLCHLARDIVKARSAINRYQELDYSFSSQRECKFLNALLQAFEQNDVEGFTNVVYEYDSVTKFTPWQTKILLKVKAAIKENSGENVC